MTVQDVLIGSSKVIVETDSKSYEYNLDDSQKKTITPEEEIPSQIQNALEENGIFVLEYPMEITRYVHDEGTRIDQREIAEKIGEDGDSEIVKRIAGYGYEIELKFEIHNSDGTKTAYLTHIDGIKLDEKRKI